MEEREGWKRCRMAHAEELDDLEERLEAEVARNHRLQRSGGLGRCYCE